MADWQRRAEEAWRRARGVGAFLEVGRSIQVGDELVEVVATLADATQTVVAYRAPPGSDLMPSPVDPPGGAAGRVMGDLLVSHMPPAEGSAVLVNFGDFGEEEYEVELPIDRARTRPYERQAVSLPGPFTTDGAQLAIRGATVGLLMATVELEVTSDNPAMTAAAIGSGGIVPQPHRQVGPGPLWREWFPPSEPLPARTETGDDTGGSPWRVEVRFGASTTAEIRHTTTPGRRWTPRAPAPPPPRPWQVRALPGGQALAMQGSSGRGGPVPETLAMATTLQFDPPLDEASEVELVLNELFIFHRCDKEPLGVPGPRPGEVVDLHGHSLGCGSRQIELVRWETDVVGQPQLVVQSDSRLWPDVRVVAENASASLWLRPGGDSELVGGLPGIYGPLFAGGQVVLGLRMLGVRADLPAITIPLSQAEKSLP